MSLPLTSASTTTSSTNNQKKYNPHELSEAELKTIPEDEKQALLQMPGESGSPWDYKIGNYGKYYITMGIFLEKITPTFLQMLRATEQSEDVTHLSFGGFNFKLDRGQVIRTQANTRKKTSSGNFRPASPRYIEDFFFGTPEEVKEFIQKDKGNWEEYGPPHYNDDRDIIRIGVVKKKSVD